MVRTRFAPSPTGYLHIGGLRTAMYAYLFAKKNGGKFILRIEDTDLERYVPGAVEIIVRTLKNAGMVFDEGPEIGGDCGPYVQSERKEIYQKYAKKLIESGDAYYCFCTKERLEDIHKAGATKYDKHCLSIPRAEAEKRIAAGEKYVIRQNIPPVGSDTYTDLVFGDITVDYKDLEDNVLIKSDGMPTYNFANVIDDHLMGIDYVIRGVEYLSSTPKYNLLYRALGWEIPNYIHLQPIMRDERHKLSKRDGDASYEDFIKKGYLSEAIVNYIALLGWSGKDDREKFTLKELEERFDIEGLSKSPSVFDENKMRWLNSLYMRELDLETFHEYALPFYEKLDYLKGYDLKYITELVHSRCEVFPDVGKLTAFLNEFDGFDLTAFVNAKWKTDCKMALKLIPELKKAVEAEEEKLSENLEKIASDGGYKKGQVLWIFRIAITGAPVTPGGATEMAHLLGKDRCLSRLSACESRLKEFA